MENLLIFYIFIFCIFAVTILIIMFSFLVQMSKFLEILNKIEIDINED